MTPSDHDPMIGRRIAHYSIEDKLGQGGMGAVYLARDTRLDRVVAFKVIAAAAGTDPALKQRLLREARAASALNHPNIVTIYEIGEAEGLDFIAMERIEGRPLASLIAPGGLPIEQVLDLGEQITSAVAAAHGAHIVHRDLKPANVMVTPAGSLKVLDFGLAQFVPPTRLDEAAPTMPMPTQLTGKRVILGTIGYMSPEQIESQPIHGPSDVFTLGIILYEMLTGRRPFAGDSDWSVLAATIKNAPAPVQSLRPETPAELARVVARCLERRPEDRYGSAADLAEDLRKLAAARAPGAAGARGRQSRAVLIGALALAAIAVAVPTWLLMRESRLRWARGPAIAEIQKRRAAGDLVGAYAIAHQAIGIAPQDPVVRDAWDRLIARVDVESEPAGAEVAVHSYIGGDRWLPLGTTPLKGITVPFGFSRWRLVRPGYDTLLAGQGHDRHEFALVPSGTAPPGMVFVPKGSVDVESNVQTVELPEFWIERCEVTNRQYQAFMDAGGYRRPELWKEPFIRDGRTMPWKEAMGAFLDATGRPGPATWEFGRYPAGQDDLPVTGVSWYEAAAYAAYAGRQLPTVYHWYRVSGSQGVFSEIVTQSNVSAKGPAPVASMGGLGPFGTYDMAGNAKEWCWSATGDKRYILGGGWNELAYAFHDEDARSPFEREAAFGFRCMMQPEPLAAHLAAPLQAFERDPASLVPVGDEVFQAYRRLYDYDPAPLDARVESVNDRSLAWREEVVTVRAAYGSERLPMHVYVPKGGTPPYQAVVIFPGSNATRTQSSRELQLRMSDFHVRAGRVLVYPIYQGTYERRTPGPKGMNELRDIMIQRGKDIRRTVDYLATRPDIDTTKIAFYGISLGAQLGPLLVGIEPRFRNGVFFSGGFETWEMPPECDPVNFTPRVRVPILMVNGREDFDLPYESAQVPMFRMLGTPEGEKQHVVLAGGHIPLHPEAAIRAMSEWLDSRFGAPR